VRKLFYGCSDDQKKIGEKQKSPSHFYPAEKGGKVRAHHLLALIHGIPEEKGGKKKGWEPLGEYL